MSRKTPAPQNRAVQLNLSVPLYISDLIDEQYKAEGYKNRSAWAVDVFKAKLQL